MWMQEIPPATELKLYSYLSYLFVCKEPVKAYHVCVNHFGCWGNKNMQDLEPSGKSFDISMCVNRFIELPLLNHKGWENSE